MIIAAIIAIWPQIKAQPAPVSVPATGLEAELSKANIILTEVTYERDHVREWLISDPQYQVMARTCLTVLIGKRVIVPIPLDVIVGKYRVSFGGSTDTNYPADKYTNMDIAKDAIFETWN